MRKLLFSLLTLVLFTGFCEAQIVVVRFKNEKVAKRYKKHTRLLGEDLVLLGEPVPGGGIRLEGNQIFYRGASADPRANDQNELFVLDAKDPEAVPYHLEDGEKVVRSRKSVVAIPGADIAAVEIFMRGEDLLSLAKEYRFRRERIRRYEDARDEEEKGGTPWFAAHRLLVLEYQRLRSWLEQNTFFAAAKKLEKKLAKELRASKDDALAARAEKALASIHTVDTYPSLVEAAAAITGGATKYSVKESQHVRLVYFQDLPHVRAKACLELAERMIEGFRVECVDRWVSETFPDQIPDGLFLEIMWTPEDFSQYVRFVEEYYGVRLTDRERQAQMRGKRISRMVEPKSIFIYRLQEGFSPEGATAHSLGHALADYHYNGGPMGMNIPWLSEGLAYYVSFEYTGRNSVVCKSFAEGDYVKPERGESERTWFGLRDIYHRTALESGRRLDRMSLLGLHELEDGDLAKAWSVLDWVTKELDGEGQAWLRQGCVAARNRSRFLAEWRAASEEIFGVASEKDVFAVLDGRWREFAERHRDASTSDDHRRKRR